jgi:protein-tyrosine phosphatase
MCTGGGTTTVRLMSSPTADVQHPDRWVRLHAVHNFRDLGGYQTENGRRTRWRTIFRADGLFRLTTKDLLVVKDLGVRTVIDLRTADEIAERGRFPVDRHEVEFHHLSVLDQTWDMDDARDWAGDPAGFLRLKYHLMLAEGGERIGRALDVLSREATGVAVFHCAAGKDRTGLLAAMLLAGLGVDDEVIAADFALSGEADVRTREWIREHAPEFAAAYDEIPAIFRASDPASMHGLLGDIRTEHGTVRDYCATVGVGSDVWHRLEDRFLTA